MAEPRRNDPCPCGSGRRYKECHGKLQADATQSPMSWRAPVDPVAQSLAQARECFGAGDITRSAALCKDVLKNSADHPEALGLLARCHMESGRPDEALRSLLQAIHALPAYRLAPHAQHELWTALNHAFTQSLSGLGSTEAAARRSAYEKWVGSRWAVALDGHPLVSVVLVLSNDIAGARVALESVCRQTYRDIELVVSGVGTEAQLAQQWAPEFARCPFAWRIVASERGGEAALANAGVRASSGEYVNVLPPGARFSETRIADLVEGIARSGIQWGFSAVDFVDSAGHRIDPAAHPAAKRWFDAFDAIDEADTLGYALIAQDNIAVSIGNLFFARTLFEKLGGFRELPHTCAWDFCLRALWLDEPVRVATAGYRHPLSAQDAAPAVRSEIEIAQMEMFAEFYADACSDAVPPNPYAPSLCHWQLHFLKRPFQFGHVLAFPLEWLEYVAEEILRARSAQLRGSLERGLTLAGFAYGEFGLGENLRALAKTCLAGDIPFAVKDVDMRLKARQADRTLAPFVVDALRHHTALFCLNPDMLKPIRQLLETGKAAGRYNIGYWFWELEQIPDEWDFAFELVDEIWVATEFVGDAIGRATSKPVIKVPTPVEVTLSRPYRRADFGLPEDRFLFLFSFDFNSFIKRKNPEAAIAAFKRAFPASRRDVGLVLKSINGSNRPDKLGEIQQLIAGDDRIVVTDGFLSRDQVSGLQSVVDVFVSLHRAEGLGLGLAESMYQGKPVIGTGYSGNMEFMNAEVSCLVDYELVPIRKGEYLYDDERFRWAEPDPEHAAHHMKRLADDAAFRANIARRGQAHIRSYLTYANAAALMERRLRELDRL